MNSRHRFAGRKRCALLLCGALALGAVAAPTAAHAFVSRPECKSLLDLTPLADESTLSAADRAALTKLREMAAADDQETKRSNRIPPTIYNFNSLFVAINPGAGKTEDFGTRSLIITTSIDGTIHAAKHAIRSPHYRFSYSMSSMIVSTFLMFYGDRLLLVALTHPVDRKGGESIVFTVEPDSEAPCSK